MFGFLLGWFERVRYHYQLVQRFVLNQKFNQVGVNMDAVGNKFAGKFRVYQNCADRAGIPVVHTAHGIKQVGGMHDPHLHAFQHILIGGVGVSGLHDNSLFDAKQRQFPRVFEFRSKRHVNDFSFGGLPEAFHQRKVDRADAVWRLDAQAFRRDERAFKMHAENMGAFFVSHGFDDCLDAAGHFFFGGGVEGRDEGSDTVAGQNFGHFQNRIGFVIVGAVTADAVNMGVYEAGGNMNCLWRKRRSLKTSAIRLFLI